MSIQLNSIDELYNKYNYLFMDEKRINTINSNLKYLIDKNNLTISKLAEAVGVSRQTLNLIANGQIQPCVDLCLKLSLFLNVKVEDIFSLKENAWLKPVKMNGLSTYFDMYSLKIIDSKEKKEIIEKDDCIYYDNINKLKYTKAEYDSFLKQYINDYYNFVYEEIKNSATKEHLSEKRLNLLTKKRLTEKFNTQFVYRFKKIYKK